MFSKILKEELSNLKVEIIRWFFSFIDVCLVYLIIIWFFTTDPTNLLLLDTLYDTYYVLHLIFISLFYFCWFLNFIFWNVYAAIFLSLVIATKFIYVVFFFFILVLIMLSKVVYPLIKICLKEFGQSLSAVALGLVSTYYIVLVFIQPYISCQGLWLRNNVFYTGALVSLIFFLCSMFFYFSIYNTLIGSVGSVNSNIVDISIVLASSIFFIYLLLYKVVTTIEFYFYLECLTIITTILILILNKQVNFITYNKVVEASTLYFAISVIGGVAIILSFILTFFIINSSNLIYFSEMINYGGELTPKGFNKGILLISFSLLVFGFVVKLGLFPTYYWLADLYESASFSFLILYNLLLKPAIFVWFIRLYISYITPGFNFYTVFLILSIGSTIAGVLSALEQTFIRRFLAYSGVAQLGFSITILGVETTWEGIENVFFMYLAYLFHSIAFLVVLEILNVTCKEFYTDKMSDLQGVFRKNLSVTVGTAITFLSFSSIPPFLGFFSKISLLILLLNMGNVLLVMSLVGLTLISNFYYWKVLKGCFFIPQNWYNLNKSFLSAGVLLWKYILAYLGISVFIWFVIIPTNFNFLLIF